VLKDVRTRAGDPQAATAARPPRALPARGRGGCVVTLTLPKPFAMVCQPCTAILRNRSVLPQPLRRDSDLTRILGREPQARRRTQRKTRHVSPFYAYRLHGRRRCRRRTIRLNPSLRLAGKTFPVRLPCVASRSRAASRSTAAAGSSAKIPGQAWFLSGSARRATRMCS
jgi:hypothetical protein